MSIIQRTSSAPRRQRVAQFDLELCDLEERTSLSTVVSPLVTAPIAAPPSVVSPDPVPTLPNNVFAHQAFPDLPDNVFAPDPNDPFDPGWNAPWMETPEQTQLPPIYLPPPLGPTIPNDTP